MKVAYEHVIPAPVDQVFQTYGSEEFYIARQKGLGAISVEVLTWETGSDGKVRIKVRVSEPSKQPAFIRTAPPIVPGIVRRNVRSSPASAAFEETLSLREMRAVMRHRYPKCPTGRGARGQNQELYDLKKTLMN